MIFNFKNSKNQKIMSKQVSTQNNSNCYLYCCSGVSILCLTVFLFALPVTELTLSLIYRDDIICNSDIQVTIFEWLVLKSSINIILLLIFFILSIFDNKDNYLYSFIFFTYYLFGVFNFAWLIVGSIIFWRDCYNLEPYSINILMWVSLIMGYINIYINSVQKK